MGFNHLRRRHVPRLNGAESDDNASRNINHREPKDCVELSPPTVRDNRSNDTAEVNKRGEAMIENRRRVIAEQKLSSEVKDENRWRKKIA